MKSLMSRMVETISRISVIEERQNAVVQSTNKAIERMEAIADRQHASEIATAGAVGQAEKVKTLEKAVSDLQVENERNHARFDALVWVIRIMWVAGGAVAGIAGLLLTSVTIIPK